MDKLFAALLMVTLFIALFLVVGYFVQHCFNHVMPATFGVGSISYTQALALMALSSALGLGARATATVNNKSDRR